MLVEQIDRPITSVARVSGRISPSNPQAWTRPNLAVRLEVESPEGQRPVSRVYTVRSYDAANGRIEIDFVIHDDDSPAMRWLTQAGPGDVIQLVGPRATSFRTMNQGGKSPCLPMKPRSLPSMQSSAPGRRAPRVCCMLKPQTRRLSRNCLSPKASNVTFCCAGQSSPLSTTGRLVEAAKRTVDAKNWTVWAAGERQEARAIRSHCLEGLGLLKQDVRVFGYWRKGVSSSEIDRKRLDGYGRAREVGSGAKRLDDLDISI